MILWFSGTGNSRYVAEILAAELGSPVRPLTPDLRDGTITLPKDNSSVIWVCPVYSWGIPPYVRSIMRTASLSNPDAVHHLVLTCGDDCGLAADMWRSDLSQRGWRAGTAFSVTMPNNYVCMKGFNVDPEPTVQAKLAAAPERIREIAGKIASYAVSQENVCIITDDLVRGRFAWIKTRIIYPWFVRHAMSPRPFRHTDACISCGKCAAICPLHNITMQPVASDASDSSVRRRKYPQWHSDCAACLACYHVCPRHAVMYGDKTADKGQYMNPLIRR